MKSCRECVHGGTPIPGIDDSVYCEFPLPIYLTRTVNPLVFLHEAAICPTYQPREDRESNP